MPKQKRYPGIIAMSDGRKRIRLRAVDPRTGRMKEVDRVVTVPMGEAIVLQQQWRRDIRTADVVSVAVPRLADYATSWIKSRTLAVKPSTAETYAGILDCHVLPALGDFFLDKLTDRDVREWHAALVDRLAKQTANNALRVLKMVLGDGCAEFNLPRSPAERVRSFPVRHSPDDDPNLLSPEELGKVLDAFRSTEAADYPLALTLALTGLRFGEASALRWSDIREDEGLIRVVRGQWKGHVSTTKTGVVRSVPLVPELAATLREHRAQLVAKQHPGLTAGVGVLGRQRRPSSEELPAAAARARGETGGDQAAVHRPRLPAHVQQHRAPGGRGDRHAIDHGARHAGHDRALLARRSRGEAGRGRKRGSPRLRSENGGKWGIRWG